MTELEDAFEAWLDAPSGDQPSSDRLAEAFSKAFVAYRESTGRPLHTVTGATDLDGKDDHE